MPRCFALPQQSFSYLDVEWGGDLDVLSISIHHRYLTAETFYNGCIVGKLFLVTLVEGLFCQTDVKGLWSLHDAIIITEHIFATATLVNISQVSVTA